MQEKNFFDKKIIWETIFLNSLEYHLKNKVETTKIYNVDLVIKTFYWQIFIFYKKIYLFKIIKFYSDNIVETDKLDKTAVLFCFLINYIICSSSDYNISLHSL